MQNYSEKFKDQIMKRTYKYSLSVIDLLDKASKNYSSLIISRQLLRSATSIGANIVEAQAASSKRDFTNFINHSLKSANESFYWLKLLKDTKKITDPKIDYVLLETKELSKILASSILTLKGRK